MPLLEEVDVSRACIVGRLYSAGGAFALERPPADRPCVRFVSSSMWRAQESLRINAFLCMAVFDSYAGRRPRRSIRKTSISRRRFSGRNLDGGSIVRARDYFYLQDVEINITRKYAINNDKDLSHVRVAIGATPRIPMLRDIGISAKRERLKISHSLGSIYGSQIV